jgi:hypothetical protein
MNLYYKFGTYYDAPTGNFGWRYLGKDSKEIRKKSLV